VEAVAIDRGFKRMDDFTWHGRELWCVETRGNSPGSMSYLLKKDKRWLAFSGDVMLADARMHNWFDSEWDYGFAAGLYALFSSAALLQGYDLRSGVAAAGARSGGPFARPSAGGVSEEAAPAEPAPAPRL
jgi:glyoxylase-like metal-dependent hydrolase (beta-lactamase superfamily II)